MVGRFQLNLSGLRTPRRRAAFALALAFAFLALTAAACASEDIFTLEQRAFALDSQILCPVCDGQSIAESNAPIAQEIRSSVRKRLEEGDTDAEILNWVAVAYGENNIGSPSASNFWGLLAWTAPIVVFSVGAVILSAVIYSIRRNNKMVASASARAPRPPAPRSATTRSAVQPPAPEFIAAVERDIQRRAAADSAAPPPKQNGERS